MRGHVISVYSEYEVFGHVPDRCALCGAEILKNCPVCGQPLLGAHIADPGHQYRVSIDADVLERQYRTPNFCTAAACGAALPWADRTARIWEVENRLREEVDDEHRRLLLREHLTALLEPDLSDEEAARRWQHVREIGGKAFTRVMTDVALPLLNAKLRKDLGLP